MWNLSRLSCKYCSIAHSFAIMCRLIKHMRITCNLHLKRLHICPCTLFEKNNSICELEINKINYLVCNHLYIHYIQIYRYCSKALPPPPNRFSPRKTRVEINWTNLSPWENPPHYRISAQTTKLPFFQGRGRVLCGGKVYGTTPILKNVRWKYFACLVCFFFNRKSTIRIYGPLF